MAGRGDLGQLQNREYCGTAGAQVEGEHVACVAHGNSPRVRVRVCGSKYGPLPTRPQGDYSPRNALAVASTVG